MLILSDQLTWSRSFASCVIIEIFFVCLIHFQTSTDGIYLSRHIGLKLGIPVPVPALTVNRLCGSGFQAIINGAQVSGDFCLLRWLPVCVSHELFSICFSFVTALGPRCLADILNIYVPFWQFCSSFDACLFWAPSVKTSHLTNALFACQAPTVWDKLQHNTVHALFINPFKTSLKTELFCPQ